MDFDTEMRGMARDLNETTTLVENFVNSQKSRIDGLADKVADLEQKGAAHFAAGPPASKHDMGRVFQALADPRAQIDGFEKEWSDEFAEKSGLKLPGAVWCPLSRKSVDYNTPNFNSPLTSAGGSNLVPTELRSSEFIDLLRQRSVIMQIGPRMLDASGNLDIPKASTGASAYWIDGDGSSITESNPQYTKVQMTPKFCAAYVKYTYRMGLQSNIADILQMDLAAQIAAEIDNQAINGDATSNKPRGILNQVGINAHSYTSSPEAVTWADVVELEKLVIEDKVPMLRPAYLCGVTTYKLLKTVSRAGTEAIFLADFASGRPTLNGIPLYVSTHVPANQLILGDFSELLFATWGAVALMADPYTDFASGTTGVRAIAPIDIAVRNAVSFAVAS